MDPFRQRASSAAQTSVSDVEQRMDDALSCSGGSWWESERKRARDRRLLLSHCVVII